MAGKTRRPTDATTIELPDPLIYAIDAELGRDGQRSEYDLFDEIGFVSSNCVGQTSRDRARPWRSRAGAGKRIVLRPGTSLELINHQLSRECP